MTAKHPRHLCCDHIEPLLKDSSPTLLKSSLEAGETAVYWVKDKTGELVERPMEMAITSMEERKAQIRYT